MTASSVAGATVRVPRRTAPAHQGAGGAPTPGWNPAGRSASHWDGSESASLKYHPFGRRTEATVKGQRTYDLYVASDGGHPIAENTGGAWHREAIMDGVRWGWLYQNGDGRYTLPDALGPAALWAQTFGLDPFGNLKSEGSVNWQPNYDGSNHASNTAYDADGNTLNDGFHAYAWDAAGEMATVDSSQAVYDALGRRVEGAGAEWLYAPSGGNRLALMGGQSLNFAVVPLPSGFAVYNSAGLALYQHADWLGSSRVDSTPARTATSLTAYAPYGDPDNGMSDLGFTGKGMNLVNGATAGLYDFPFREYQPTAGRWLSPDPAGLAAVNPADPQSWNRYAYVGNQPLSAVDPLGLCGYSVSWSDTFGNSGGSTGDDGLPCETVAGGGGDGGHPRALSDAKPDHPDPGGRCILCGPWYVPPGPPASFRQALDCIKSGTDAFNLQTGLEAISGGHLGTSNFAGALLGSSVSSAISFGQDLATGRLGDSLKVAAGESFADFGLGIALRRVPDLNLNLGATLVGLADTESGPALVTASTSVSIVVPVGSAASATANFLDLAEFLGKAPVDLTVAAFSVIGCAAIQ